MSATHTQNGARSATALARDAEGYRRQSEAATARGDAAEAQLWSALAREIDDYLGASPVDDMSLFDP